jgi:hypothetical protein
MCATVWSILIIVPASFLHAYPRSPIESQPSPVGGESSACLWMRNGRERPAGMENSYLWPATRNEQVSLGEHGMIQALV